MRVFQVLDATTNAAVPANRTWYRNLHEPLVDLGHDVVLFPASDGRRAMASGDARLRADFSQRLVEKFRAEHARQPFGLFFAYLMQGMVESSAIDEIRRLGVPTCNFSCNNAHQFYLVAELARHFDYNLHSEADASSRFRAAGANPLWWPMASNPKYFHPVDVARTIQASFVGANYALRARYAAHLLNNGVDLHLYGPGWRWGSRTRWRSLAKHCRLLADCVLATSAEAQFRSSARLADHDRKRHVAAAYPGNVHDPVSDERLIELYSASHVSLGFLEVYEHHDASRPVTRHLHLREFEAPMSGALYCTGYTDELAEMFVPDDEVVVYKDEQELLDKVRFYLCHPEEAERVRLAGRGRALRDHTYHRRFETLFGRIGLG